MSYSSQDAYRGIHAGASVPYSWDYTRAAPQAATAFRPSKDDNYTTGPGKLAGADADGRMRHDGRPYDMVDWAAEERRSCLSRFWRAKWNLKPRGPKWLPEIIRLT